MWCNCYLDYKRSCANVLECDGRTRLLVLVMHNYSKLFNSRHPTRSSQETKCWKHTDVIYIEQLQQLDIITPLGMDDRVKLCNSFMLVLKLNGKVRLCLDLARLNQGLIQPVHRGPILNDIFPKLTNARYLSLLGASSRYNKLNLDEQSLYLPTFACQFGRNRYNALSGADIMSFQGLLVPFLVTSFTDMVWDLIKEN